MLRPRSRFASIAAATFLFSATPSEALDDQSAYAQVVRLDAAFAKALNGDNLREHLQAKDRAEALIKQLGNDPTDPCRTAAIFIETSRVNQWMNRRNITIAPEDKRIEQGNLRDARETIATCKTSGR